MNGDAQGMSLPMPTSFAASSSNKPRLPPTPPQPTPTFVQRADVVDPAAARNDKGHRRSRSVDVPFGYFPAGMMGGHILPPPKVEAAGGHGDADDLFNAYLNLDGMMDGGLSNSSDDRLDNAADSRGSSMNKTNDDISENDDSEEAADGREGLKRCAGAAGEPIASSRHARSLSVDSFIGKTSFNFSAVDAPGPNGFVSLEFGRSCDCLFTPAEMNKIVADDKLAEMAVADPKRVKRVLANRQSAARSKERKTRYIAELEQKVQILQTEATTLSAQLTLLQRDSAGVATQNNELKFRVQAMEQQAQLRDALTDALTTEVQRLRLATAELGDSCSSDNLAQQIQINIRDQMFQLQQQATPIPFYHLQQAQQSEAAKNHEPKE